MKDQSPDNNLEANVAAFRISKGLHEKIKRLAQLHDRDLTYQIRHCLRLGVEVEDQGGINTYVEKLIDRKLQEKFESLEDENPDDPIRPKPKGKRKHYLKKTLAV